MTSAIATTGIAAHGLVAQSIGGGGGVIRLVDAAGDSPALTTSASAAGLQAQFSEGSGGPVTVEADGSISVTGPGSIAILAQSVGSGSGLVLNGNTMFAGSPDESLATADSLGAGGTVSVTANGPVAALGANGIGIFAQSAGNPNYCCSNTGTGGGSAVTVNVSSSVTGGSGAGASAIQIDTLPGISGNQVTVNAGGSPADALRRGGDGDPGHRRRRRECQQPGQHHRQHRSRRRHPHQ